MDYRELLRKYIEHVESCEGTTFLSEYYRGAPSDVEFTEEEWADLQRLAQLL